MRLRKAISSDFQQIGDSFLVRVSLSFESAEYSAYAIDRDLDNAQIRAYNLCLLFASARPLPLLDDIAANGGEAQSAADDALDDDLELDIEENIEIELENEEAEQEPAPIGAILRKNAPKRSRMISGEIHEQESLEDESAGKRFLEACKRLHENWEKSEIRAIAKLLKREYSPSEAANFAENCRFPRQLIERALECYFGDLEAVKAEAAKTKPLSQFSIQELTSWCMNLIKSQA